MNGPPRHVRRYCEQAPAAHGRTFSRRGFLRHSCAGGLASIAGLAASRLLLPRSLSAAAPDPEKTAVDLMTPECLRAIETGLKQLATRQQEDGGFGVDGYSRNVAVCALSGLAFMTSGSTPDRGPYGNEVSRVVKYLLDNTADSGFIDVASASSHGPMYGHGFATLFLAEVYGMANNRDVRGKLAKAVKLIVDTQNREGGWRYQPQPADADISVTVCQIMALRAARNAGLYVPKETIDRCIQYVKQSQNPDGGFRYMLPGGQSAFPRSAAGLVSLYSAGIYDSPEITRGLKYLMDFIPRGERTRETHYFYGHYYAVQAMWHAGGEYWADWYPAIRDELLALQRPDGSWMDSVCLEYGTAMACLILQVPNNNLPIFQR